MRMLPRKQCIFLKSFCLDAARLSTVSQTCRASMCTNGNVLTSEMMQKYPQLSASYVKIRKLYSTQTKLDEHGQNSNGENAGRKADNEDVGNTRLTGSQLDSELPGTVTRLETMSGSKVYLVAVSHFSDNSVKDVIKTPGVVDNPGTQPDVIVLELCKEREHLLEPYDDTRRLPLFSMTGLRMVLRRQVTNKVKKLTDIKPGDEMRCAYEEAKKIPGCRIQLGDRPLNITTVRGVEASTLWKLITETTMLLITPPRRDIIEEAEMYLKNPKLLEEYLAELDTQQPENMRVYVHERNSYLAHSLQIAARPKPHPDGPPNAPVPAVVVGVMGAGHIPGIVKNWDHLEYDIKEILKIPYQRNQRSLAYAIGVCSVIAMLLLYKIVN